MGLLVVLALWAVRLFIGRRTGTTTPLDLPLLILLAMSVEALYPSTDLTLSMPKLYGIVLGVAVYYGVARGITGPRGWWIAVCALFVAAGLVAGVGLVGTNWITFKLPGGAGLYGKLPRLITSVQSSFGEITGIHPNELGGTLAFLLPLSVGVLLWSVGRSLPISPSPRFPVVALAAAALLTAGSALVLSMSRSALIGVALAGALLLWLRWRRLGYLLVAAALVAVVAVGLIGPRHVYQRAVEMDQVMRGGGSTLVDRNEIWSRAVYMMQDFPFTGIGLNTFPKVLDALYPSFTAGPDANIPHAHNIYLQTAVDLGIAGLMTFVGIWMIVGWQLFQAYRQSEGITRGALAGLGAGCLAYLVYGITDAITLGAKPLPLLWVMVGLIVVAARGTGNRPTVGHEHSGTSERGDPSTRHSALKTSLRTVGMELGRTLWMLYWTLAILFAAMAYVVVAMAATGWTP